MHLACLKSALYIKGPDWRSQYPPQYISQLFNTPSFRFTCHTCIEKTPDDNYQHDSVASTVRNIEHKLDLLTNTMIGNILNDTTQQPQPTFAEVTAKYRARSNRHDPNSSLWRKRFWRDSVRTMGTYRKTPERENRYRRYDTHYRCHRRILITTKRTTQPTDGGARRLSPRNLWTNWASTLLRFSAFSFSAKHRLLRRKM